MKIFIINLKRSLGRRTRIKRTMQKVQLNYELFTAVDGYMLSQTAYLKYVDPYHQYPREFNKGELGCLLSHYGVYKKIVEGRIPYALILEDDIEISPQLPEILEIIEPLILPGEVISLYASFPIPCNLFRDEQIDKDYYFIKPSQGELAVGAVAYIITLNAAENLIKNLLPMRNVIDDWRYWLQNNVISDYKIVFPHPIDLTDDYSDINESSGDLSLEIKKMIINNNIPILSNKILEKRKRSRMQGRRNKITIDGKKPDILFL